MGAYNVKLFLREPLVKETKKPNRNAPAAAAFQLIKSEVTFRHGLDLGHILVSAAHFDNSTICHPEASSKRGRSEEYHIHYPLPRSRLRYWIASAIWSTRMSDSPERSAMVRAIFSTRL